MSKVIQRYHKCHLKMLFVSEFIVCNPPTLLKIMSWPVVHCEVFFMPVVLLPLQGCHSDFHNFFHQAAILVWGMFFLFCFVALIYLFCNYM